MLVPTCDRCKTPNVQIVAVLGVDLCNECVAAYRDWAKAPPEAPLPTNRQRRSSKHGLAAAVAQRLLDEHGEVTPQSFGEAMSRPYRTAYFTLNYLSRAGLLERVRRAPGVVTYVAARQEAAE